MPKTTVKGRCALQSYDHNDVADIRYHLVFGSFDDARRKANRILYRHKYYGRSIRLRIWREWKDGPNGRELLGVYTTTDTH